MKQTKLVRVFINDSYESHSEPVPEDHLLSGTALPPPPPPNDRCTALRDTAPANSHVQPMINHCRGSNTQCSASQERDGQGRFHKLFSLVKVTDIVLFCQTE